MNKANLDEVICPNCVTQFQAIPVNVQNQIRRLENEIEGWKADQIENLKNQYDLVAERDEISQHLSNLLARIHRDGGHFEAEHGRDMAVESAVLIVASFNAALDEQLHLNATGAEREYVLLGKIEGLTREQVGLRLDAERYRWLRSSNHDQAQVMTYIDGLDYWESWDNAKDVDTSVDEAMKSMK